MLSAGWTQTAEVHGLCGSGECKLQKPITAQKDVFTKGAEGCWSSKSDHWKAKARHQCVLMCYLIVTSFQKSAHQSCLLFHYKWPFVRTLDSNCEVLKYCLLSLHKLNCKDQHQLSLLAICKVLSGIYYYCCGKYITLLILHLFHGRTYTANSGHPL